MAHPSVEMITPRVPADPAIAYSWVAADAGYPGMATGEAPDGTGNPFDALTADPPT